MSKRFTDTEKYKKPFIKSLLGPYKLLWDYICLDCNHAGIWIVDFEVAQVRIGQDMPVDKHKAIEIFNRREEKIIPFDGGEKWFIKDFIDFQYNSELNEKNRVHASVLNELKRYDLLKYINGNKGRTSALQGAKDKYIYKDKDKDKDKGGGVGEDKLETYVLKRPDVRTFSLRECLEIADLIPMTEQEATGYFHERNGQGWKKSNGLPITSLQSDMHSWKTKSHKFNGAKNITPKQKLEELRR